MVIVFKVENVNSTIYQNKQEGDILYSIEDVIF